ncbi:hypothetical protein M433DRAFT_359278 [Acidomyces richmondensis BFW]|nr:hypothetical protein M433DRAFT_359278 [Acidomyces richmondensis BFW]
MGDLLLFDILRPESSHLLSRTRAEASAASENFKQKAIRLVENGQTLVANKMGCPRNGWLLEVIAGIMERGEETCISEPYAQGSAQESLTVYFPFRNPIGIESYYLCEKIRVIVVRVKCSTKLCTSTSSAGFWNFRVLKWERLAQKSFSSNVIRGEATPAVKRPMNLESIKFHLL